MKERPYDKLNNAEKEIVRQNFYLGIIDAPTDTSTKKDMGLSPLVKESGKHERRPT